MMARKLDLLDDVRNVAAVLHVGVVELMCTLAGVLRDLRDVAEVCRVAREMEKLPPVRAGGKAKAADFAPPKE